MTVFKTVVLALGILTLSFSSVWAVDEPATVAHEGSTPDLRDDGSDLTVQSGNLVIVPIPMSGPTLDSGLILGEMYFHGQTEEQARKQPASVTGAAGMYTSSDSKALALVHQGYWKDDTWRFTAAAGAADLNLSLSRPLGDPGLGDINWRIKGNFLYLNMLRRLGGNWYAGALARYIDAEQQVGFTGSNVDFDLGAEVTARGVGAVLEYDSRDMPTNSYSGRHFKVEAVLNAEAYGSDKNYQSYSSYFRSYHEMNDSLVLAWELRGCDRGGKVPLWEACTVGLRGFSATDYLGRSSVSGQAEARWRMSERWGLVGFGGVGYVTSPFSEIRGRTAIPSYGLGIRFMVLPAKRINIRVDYGRSTDSNAIHLSVGEAF